MFCRPETRAKPGAALQTHWLIINYLTNKCHSPFVKIFLRRRTAQTVADVRSVIKYTIRDPNHTGYENRITCSRGILIVAHKIIWTF